MKKLTTRIISLLLALAMLLALAACGSSSSDTEDSEEDTTEDTSTEAVEEEEADAEEAAESEEEEEEEEDSDSPVYGGTLVVYQNGFHSEFDPSVYTDRNYTSLYLDSLWNLDWSVDRDEMDFSSSYIDSTYLTGQIAESWEIADDYSSITVYLRQDVYFQDKSEVGMDDEYDIYDGRQMVASDVKYSYDRILGLDGVELVQMELTDWPTTLACVESIEVIDDFTVVFNFNTTDELSVNNFMCAFVMICGPEWDELTDEQQTDWHYAAGTGPFILTNYVTDNTMSFVANPNYWDTDEDGNPLPYVDGVELIYISESATALSSFIAGEVDILASAGDVIDSDQATQLAASLSSDEYSVYNYVDYATSITIKQGSGSIDALLDVNVRTAMQYAIDVATISEYMGYTYDSTEEALTGIFAAGTAWNDISNWGDDLIASYTTYDPEYAMELLEEAGYGDGFEFTVYVFSMMYNDAFALAAEYLQEVGITMNIEVASDIVSMVTVGEDETSADLSYSLPNTGLFASTVSSAYAAISSSGANNIIFHSNDEIDELCELLIDATSLEDQIAYAQELDATVMAQHYFLLLTYNSQYSNYYRSYVKGLEGEAIIQNYYLGFMLARTWLDE